MNKPELSRRERQIMEILYQSGSATVAEVIEQLPDPLSRSAVRTFLVLMEGKGHVTRTKEGREFRYSPTTQKSAAADSALSKVLDVFFNGSISNAVAARFTGNTKKNLPPEEITQLEKLISEAKHEQTKSCARRSFSPSPKSPQCCWSPSR